MSIFAGHNAQVAMAMVIDHPFISEFGTFVSASIYILALTTALLPDLIDVFRGTPS